MSDVTRVPDGGASDAELITAVRQGDTAAFGALYERHDEAARRVAQRYVPTADADDVVAGAFEKILEVLRAGKGPDVAFRAYLFTVVRRRAIESLERARRTTATEDVDVFDSVVGPLASSEEPVLRGFEDRTVARAFESLPERWRTVLWYLDIEQQTPATVAPALGMSANGVSALAYRAREGLRQAYLQAHLTTAGVSDDCRAVNDQLGSYARGGLSRRETTRVEGHLDVCALCRAAALELGDLAQGMRAVVAPLVLGTLGFGCLGMLPLGGTSVAGAAGAGAAAGDGFVAMHGDAGAGVLGPAAGGGPAAPGAAAAGATPGGAAVAPAAGLVSALAQVPVAVLVAASVVLVGGVVAAVVAFSSGSSPVAPSRVAPAGAEIAQPPVVPPVVGTRVPVADVPTDGPTSDPTTDPAAPFVPPAGPGVPPLPTDAPPAVPTNEPTDGPTSEPTDEPTSEPTSEPTDEPTSEPTSEPTDEPTSEPTAEPTIPPTSPPTSTPTSPPTSTPTSPPTDDPVAPTSLRLAISQLRALGTASVTFSVTNTAEQSATDVEVELTLPKGVYLTGDGLSDTPADVAMTTSSTPVLQSFSTVVPQTFSALVAAAISDAVAPEVSDSWSCSTTATSVLCSLPDIAPGAQTSRTLDLMLDVYGVSTLDVAARVTTAGGSTTMTLPVAVEPAAAQVEAMVLDDSLLVVDGAGYLSVAVTNTGEVSTPAIVRVTLPEGADWPAERGAEAALGRESWSCAPLESSARTIECSTAELLGNPPAGDDTESWERLDLPVETWGLELGKGELAWGPDGGSLSTSLYWPAQPLGVTLTSEDVFLPRPAQYEVTEVGVLSIVVSGRGRAVSGARAVVELPELIVLDGTPTVDGAPCVVDGRLVVCALSAVEPTSQLRIDLPVRAAVGLGAGTVWVPAYVEVDHHTGPVVLGWGEGLIQVQGTVPDAT